MITNAFREIPSPTPLCKQHYHLVYSVIGARQIYCATCSTALKYPNYRKCTDHQKIEEYYKNHTDFDGQIDVNDKVCLTCYKAHLVIIKNNCQVSIDADLEQRIDNLKRHTPLTQVGSVKGVIDEALNTATIEVGKILLDNGVVLLPTVYDLFEKYLTLEHASDNSNKVTSRYILSHLKATFEHHITYICKACKYGTLIYRPNTDFINTTAKLLWKQRKNESTSTVTKIDADEVLDDLNDRVHQQAQLFTAMEDQIPFDYANLDIDAAISQIDPVLWKAMYSITRSKTERKHTSKVKDPFTQVHFNKKNSYVLLDMRHNVLFGQSLLCTNAHTSYRLSRQSGWVSTTDKGTQSIGVCASFDTLSRFIQYKSDARNDPSHDNIISEAFMFVSADNIDFEHKFAKVFNGNKNASWHGTTVQVIQPIPGLSIIPSSASSYLASSTADLLASITPADLLASTTPADLLASITPADVLASTTPADLLAASTASAHLLASTTPADLLASTTPADLLASITPADLLASTTPADLLASITPADLLASTTPAHLLASTTLNDPKLYQHHHPDLSPQQTTSTIECYTSSRNHRALSSLEVTYHQV